MSLESPRVLVVSHNVFSNSGNMGKTMMRMLGGIPPERLAQLYFHQEIPTRKCCLHYFRITDSDILHSVFTRRARYKKFEEKDIDESVMRSRTDTGNLAKVYQFSRRRTPMIYLLRNWMWTLGKWKTKALREWTKSFAPDAIFWRRVIMHFHIILHFTCQNSWTFRSSCGVLMTFSLNQGEMENCSEEYNAGIYWTWREKRQSVQRALLPSAMRCRETMSSYSDSRCRRFAFPVKKIDFHCQGISALELSMSGIWASTGSIH